MPRPRKSIPTYRRHKKTGRAVVTVYKADGARTEILLSGGYNSQQSKKEYENLLAQLRAGGGTVAAPEVASVDITISEVVDRFMNEYVDRKYRRPDGTETGEKRNFIMSVRPLIRLFGGKLAREFTARDLRTYRESLISGNWMTDEEKAARMKQRGRDGTTCRRTTNQRVSRIKKIFVWAANLDSPLVPEDVCSRVQLVPALEANAGSGARESEDVEPVPQEDVDKTLPHLPELYADLVRLQLYSGARAGEILRMKSNDIDQSKADVWTYEPRQHKNAWRGQKRTIVFGPKSQLILRRYLSDADAYIFRPGTIRQSKTYEHRPHYSVVDYDKAIARAAKKAGVPHGSSHQLRHLAAQLAEEQVSLEGARSYLGHKTVDQTAHYAKLNKKAAAEVARRIG